MAKFNRKGKGKGAAISTASLPDIIFMLLFFFMVTTVMREVELKISIAPPSASEAKKLERKDLVTYVYIRAPQKSLQNMYGKEPRIQLNDSIKDIKDVKEYVINERTKMPDKDQGLITVSMKIDKEAKMGIVTDVKQELRKAQALKISYSSTKGASKE